MELKLKVLNNKILIEKYDRVKKEKKSGGSPFADFAETLETNDNLGVVIAFGESLPNAAPVGTKVYFGNKYEKIYIKGSEVFVMDYENLVGIVEDN